MFVFLGTSYSLCCQVFTANDWVGVPHRYYSRFKSIVLSIVTNYGN
jgi:hypothetical protein